MLGDDTLRFDENEQGHLAFTFVDIFEVGGEFY